MRERWGKGDEILELSIMLHLVHNVRVAVVLVLHPIFNSVCSCLVILYIDH